MSEEVNKELEVLWTVQQVAKYLSLHPVTIYHWLSKGKIIDPSKIVRVGSHVRIPRSEVERLAGNIKKKLETN